MKANHLVVYFFGRILGGVHVTFILYTWIGIGGDFLRVYILENQSFKIQNTKIIKHKKIEKEL